MLQNSSCDEIEGFEDELAKVGEECDKVVYIWNNILNQVLESRFLMYLLLQQGQKSNLDALNQLCQAISDQIGDCDLNEHEPTFQFEDQTNSLLLTLKENQSEEQVILKDSPDI